MSELAVIAPQVEASLAPEAAAEAAEHAGAVATALEAAAAALHDEATRREAAADALSAGTPLLRELAEALAAPRAGLRLDRLVHALVGDLLRDALTVARTATPDARLAAEQSARAFALTLLARDPVLWPGAGPRRGCTYTGDSLLATLRLAALAA